MKSYKCTCMVILFCLGFSNIIHSQSLEIEGDAQIRGRITNVKNPIDSQDVATKSYVDVLSEKFKTLENTVFAGGAVQDIDGNFYNTVKIGTQVWMSENLKVTKYNDGTTIAKDTSSTSWAMLSSPAYCWYNNDSLTHAATFGALYNWYTIADTNSRNVCPLGWRIPSEADWNQLRDFLDTDPGTGVFENNSGAKLKQAGTSLWLTTNSNTDNSSGFTALPAGVRENAGSFEVKNESAYFWSSKSVSSTGARAYNIFHLFDYLTLFTAFKTWGMSARCIKN